MERNSRRQSKLAILFLLASLPVWAQITTKGNLPVQGNTVLSRRQGIVCGPPNYQCSSTSQAIVPLPNPLPVMGKRGDIAVDNLSGARILQLTDANSSADFNTACPDVRVIPGVNWRANFSGNDTEWTINANDTLVAVGRASAGQYDILSVNYPQQFGCIYSVPSKSISFDHTNPNILWDLEQSTPACSGLCIVKRDFTGCSVSGCNPPTTVVYDFKAAGNCLAATNAIKWFSIPGVDSTSSLFTFGVSDTGGQETGVLVVAYKIGSGCRVINVGNVADGGIAAQTAVGDWGPTGTISWVNASNPAEYGVLHETFSTNGNPVEISLTACKPYPPYTNACSNDTPFIWDVTTSQVTAAYVSGHFCPAQNLIVFGNFGGGQMATLDTRNIVGNPPPQTKLITTAGLAGFKSPNVVMDQHCSWNNALTGDTAFVFVSWDTVGRTLNGLPIQGTPSNPFAGPFNNEVDGYPAANPPSGTIHRMFHTYSSTTNPDFQVQYTDGSVSPDGKYYVFTSDWVNTLGTDPNGLPRGDVFMVELK